jgi:hypothetical protein
MNYFNDKRKYEYIQRRNEDITKTEKIEKFVDKIYKENKFDFKRISNKELQKKGVDIIHNDNGKKNFIDEKFAINYYNKPLNTFAFELSSNNNENNEGWFISNHMITTHYIILWFQSDDNFSNIYTYDLCYIDKQKIKEYLKTIGYYDGIVDEFKQYWTNGHFTHKDNHYYVRNNRRYLVLSEDIKIVQSLQFEVECPINIIIPRKKLYELADYHFMNK